MKIGIIGGGSAGLLSAYLLQDDSHVTIFEKDKTLGGHIKSKTFQIENENIQVDIGFKYFSKGCSETLLTLLKILDLDYEYLPSH